MTKQEEDIFTKQLILANELEIQLVIVHTPHINILKEQKKL